MEDKSRDGSRTIKSPIHSEEDNNSSKIDLHSEENKTVLLLGSNPCQEPTEPRISRVVYRNSEEKTDQDLLREHLIDFVPIRSSRSSDSSSRSTTFDSKREVSGVSMGNQLPKERYGNIRYGRNNSPLKLDGEEEEEEVFDVSVKGNCPRPWSDHLYFKLFLDVDGRNSTLLVLKCDITCVNVFTDVEMTLYKSRFIGGKQDSISESFVFDLMKSDWEQKIPRLQVIELTIDIVMSSSPNHACAEALLKLIQLEKKYLKLIKFDGKLNVQLRFAHSFNWSAKNLDARTKAQQGLQSLYQEGVVMETMDKDSILEEMKVDRIRILNERIVEDLIKKRLTWSPPPPPSEPQPGKAKGGYLFPKTKDGAQLDRFQHCLQAELDSILQQSTSL